MDGSISSEANLVRIEAGEIERKTGPATVGDLERALLSRFPAEHAEAWDRTGMTVGDPSAALEGVACALDATRDAVVAAAKAGANVLVTHHPAFLDPPETIAPTRARAAAAGTVVWEAVRREVALMSFHTALDVSEEGSLMLPRMLGLEAGRVLVPTCPDGSRGYGRLCMVRPDDGVMTLATLAARATSVFARMPRVWGDFSSPLRTIATATGSAGNVVDECVKAGVDCLVCGEVKYHDALEGASARLAIVELGHDTSELPFAALLAQEVERLGIDKARIAVIAQQGNWQTPEAMRI